MSDLAGRRVGDYEILAELGAGGMGRVFKVRNVISNREEAMKILHPDFASDPDLAARFMAEIRTLAGLEHPGIAQLRTAFQLQNQFVMVMECVEGTTLEKLAAQHNIPIKQVLDYGSQVLAALSYAHSRGVTHRDIKPANIMITSHGLVKLMDFGIAKSTNDMQLTRPGTTMGSVYYMSPEQVRGGTIDGRSDLYSFGVTLYELLTGSKPFQADTSYSVLNAQLNDAPKPLTELNPAVPPALNDIVLRAMAKNPDERYQTADDFRNAIKAVREAQATAAMPAVVAAPVSPAAPPAQPVPAPDYSSSGPSATGVYPPPPAPAFVPVPPVAAPPPAPRSHRGLWIGIGAVTAILALVAIAALVPRMLATHASQKSAATADTTAAQPVTTTPAPVPDAATTPASTQPVPPSASPSATPQPSPQPSSTGQPRTPHSGSSTHPAQSTTADSSTAQTAPAPAPSQPSGPSPQELREAHGRLIDLTARAQAADSGIQQMRSQQQAQGLDMRGDILAAMNRMHSDLNEANSALNQRDLDTAKTYLDRADHEIATLEKFLGR